MKWIHHFSAFKIPFYTYKLNKDDSIIFRSINNTNKTIIILHGIVYLLKIFTNGEILTIAILNNNNIINTIDYIKETKNHYYKAIAMETTYIITFQWDDIIVKYTSTPIILTNIIKSYQQTLYRYENMHHICSHQYIQNRVIQLILFLFKEFGLVKKKHIILPFEISQTTISTIIGSNKVTINKIIHRLCSAMLIKYSKNKKIHLEDPFALSYINEKK